MGNNSTQEAPIHYNGDGQIYFSDFNQQNIGVAAGVTSLTNSAGTIFLRNNAHAQNPSGTVLTCKVCATETDNFKAPEPITITVTVA